MESDLEPTLSEPKLMFLPFKFWGKVIFIHVKYTDFYKIFLCVVLFPSI